MKNHWLDKKADKELDLEIDKACEGAFTKAEFKDTDFIDISNMPQHNDRYKEYERLATDISFLKELKGASFGPIPEDDFVNKVMNKSYDINNSTDQEDRDMMKAILLKNMHKTHWIEEVLGSVSYVPHLAPGCDLTIGNLTIDCGVDLASGVDQTSTSFSYVTPGGDSITLGDLPGWKDGKIVDMDLWKGKCDKCGEYQWPMNSETTMGQGDPTCACYRNCNLDIWYGTPFIQNEKLEVLEDNGYVAKFQVMHTPILPGTMTGTIYPTPGNTAYGYVFCVSSSGQFTFTRFVNENGKVEYANGSDDPWHKEKAATLEESDRMTLEKMANSDFCDKFMGWYDEVHDETNLNLATGVLEVHYHMGHCPEIFVSYEYNLESL